MQINVVTNLLTKIIAVFVLLFFIGNDCFGATYVQGIKVTCTPHSFIITAHNSEDGTSETVVRVSKDESIYYGFKKHHVTWRFGKHIASANFNAFEPRDKGQCGARPGSRVSLWLDGKIIMHGFFDNDCYESLSVVSLEEKKGIGIVLKICGHTAEPGCKDYCFDFQGEDFKSLTKPIPSFPISEFRNKFTVQKNKQ